jgi:hypothetical protein
VRTYLAVAATGCVAAIALAFVAESAGVPWQAILALAAWPLLILTVPAGLLAWAKLRHGDPYNVEHRYR